MTLSKILLIDDDEIHHIATLAAIQSQDSDAEVIHAYDAREALEFLEKGLEPDVILLDIKMPDFDGFAFLTEFTSRGFDSICPVVILSASYDQQDKNKAFSFKCVPDYICKPFSKDDMDRISIYTKDPRKQKSEDIILQC